ncbi:MAG: hypothetical protein ABDH25_03865 [Dictyoglomaceae bacterium]
MHTEDLSASEKTSTDINLEASFSIFGKKGLLSLVVVRETDVFVIKIDENRNTGNLKI